MSARPWTFILFLIHSLNAFDNSKCPYFIYDSTPIPLGVCQQKEHSKSIMYLCEDDIVSYNAWNSSNCSGPLDRMSTLDSSRTTAYHCNDHSSSPSECSLATLDLWSNPICFDSPYYQLKFVVDICVP